MVASEALPDAPPAWDPAQVPAWACGGMLLALALGAVVLARWMVPAGLEIPSTALWPGVLLAARVIRGPRFRTWIWGVALAAALLEALLAAPIGAAALAAAAGRGALIAGGVLLAARWVEATLSGPFMERPADVARFVGYACLAVPLGVALLGAGLRTAVGLTDAADTLYVARSWWLGQAFGQVIVAPTIIAICRYGRAFLAKVRAYPAEAVIVPAAVLAIYWVVLRHGFWIQPAMIGVAAWATFRFRAVGASLLITLLAVSFAYITVNGVGPFAQPSPEIALQLLQVRMTFQFAALLCFHAVMVENEHNLGAVKRQHAELQTLYSFKEASADALAREVEARTEEARRARDEAEAANAAKSMFLARMSHEIRTPITAMTGFSELLGDPAVRDEDRVRFAAIMRRNSEHLSALIDDILDVTRIEAGKLMIERLPFAPAELLDEIGAAIGARAREKGLAFVLRVDGPLPPVIETDPTRLRQVLLNLAGNAVKFTERGSVTIDAEVAGGTLRVTVTDTGLGMGADQQERLFRPFEQADSSMTRRFGGAGLGLAIAQALVEALDGRLDVRSAPGAGSTFTLTLPVGLPEGGAQTTRLRAAAAPEQPVAVRLAGRILLAEDGPDNRVLFGAILRRAGLDLEIVEDGQAAVTRVLAARSAGRPFDLVLMDMQMPVLDGYGATRALREAGWAGPILAVTAHAMAGERDRCLAAGCDEYLTKPIGRGILLDALARHLPASAGAPEPVPAEAAPLGFDGLADDPEMRELVAMFVGGLAARMAAIATAVAAGDRDRLGELAHQLKGAAGGYGFPAITARAADLYQAAQAGGEVAPQVAALAAQVALAQAIAEAG